MNRLTYLDVFGACPRLERLSIFESVSEASWFEEAGRHATAARAGGASLLRSLAFQASDPQVSADWSSGCTLRALAAAGAAFPELEELALESVFFRYCDPNDSDGGDGGAVQLPAAWAPLPRLQRVEVRQIGGEYNRGSVAGASCDALLAGLAGAAPNLRSLSVTRGGQTCAAEAAPGRTTCPSLLASTPSCRTVATAAAEHTGRSPLSPGSATMPPTTAGARSRQRGRTCSPIPRLKPASLTPTLTLKRCALIRCAPPSGCAPLLLLV